MDDALRIMLFMIPEGIVITFLGYKLLNVKADRKMLFIAGICYGASIFPARLVNTILPFGSHQYVLALVFSLIGVFYLGVRFRYAFFAWATSMAVMLFSEAFLLPLIFKFTNINFETTLQNAFFHIAFGWLMILPLIIILALHHKLGFVLLRNPIYTRGSYSAHETN